MTLLIHADPHAYGIERSRWRLRDLSSACEALAGLSESGVFRFLDRWGFALKRGRDHLHSPDPDYVAKLQYNRTRLLEALEAPQRSAFLLMDEMSYYRHPSLASAYEATGKAQPLARRSHQSKTQTRVVAVLSVGEGQVTYRQGSKCGVAELVSFYQGLRESYPTLDRLYLELDNWPVHFHPDLLVALEPQEFPWTISLPPNWPTEASRAAQRRWGGLKLPIQLLPLPTYAPWTNPIEKLWRWLRQEVLHLHPWADRLEELRREVAAFLNRFAQGSKALLRYVGLSDPETLYAGACNLRTEGR